MKTVIKLVIALALANAVVRTGMVALSYYQLKDAAQQEVTWGGNVPAADLARHVMDKAAELGVPLESQNLDLSRNKELTVLEAYYTQPIEIFPTFIYPVELSFTVQARAMAGLK
jgi:hypothetical protein